MELLGGCRNKAQRGSLWKNEIATQERNRPGTMGTQFFLKKSNHSFPQTKAVQLETVSFCSGKASLTQRIRTSPASEVYLPTSTISQHQAQRPHSSAQQTLLLWHGPCSQDQESQALLMFLSHQWACRHAPSSSLSSPSSPCLSWKVAGT